MKKFLFGVILVGVFGLILVVAASTNNSRDDSSNQPAESELTLRDAHGLAVDVSDPSKVYIASHNGLYVLKNDGELSLLGNGRDDFMGFSVHPSDPNVFFTSGHPARGGNLGFQKSTDGGKSWKKVSNGLNGPVDFHTMAVDEIDPNIIYGIYLGRIQKSSDGGKSWQYLNDAPEGIVQLAAGAKKGTVYAATTNGLYVSNNQGSSWQQKSGVNGTVIAAAANPQNEQELYAYSQAEGFVKTTDSGNSWTKLDTPFNNDMVLHIAYDKSSSETVYVITRSLSLYKTADAGLAWKKIR